MAKTNPDTIILRDDRSRLDLEGSALAAITPGEFLEYDSTSTFDAPVFKKIATAKLNSPRIVAVQNQQVSSETAGQIDIDYAASDNVFAVYAKPGYQVYAFVPAAAPAIVAGDLLEFDATGALQKVTTGVAVATALEAKDNSLGGTKARIRVQLI